MDIVHQHKVSHTVYNQFWGAATVFKLSSVVFAMLMVVRSTVIFLVMPLELRKFVTLGLGKTCAVWWLHTIVQIVVNGFWTETLLSVLLHKRS